MTSSFILSELAGALVTQPNVIVIQPDDHYFFQEWDPPGLFGGANSLKRFPKNSNGLPNINRIRQDGIEMKSAYAASTMCGTSRYSTITGRYPSRSSYGRAWDEDSTVRDVTIKRTKLEDTRGVSDPNDCSENNIAALLQRNGYMTGVVGKWHLTSDDERSYTYRRIRNDIKDCGFDFAEAIYKENLWGDWYGDATHNMEHVTSEAIRFIEDAVENEDKPFFLYFNPTVPHSSGDVTDALKFADCQDTVGGRLSDPPNIPYGMTADFDGDCEAYRESVLDRGGTDDDKMAGAVWVDDAVGSLFQVLESLEIIENTFILFQLDHGEDSKGSLFEGGSRIVQFIHYPKLISRGSSFHGLVSTIDVAATVATLAGIPEGDRYKMDGKSWISEVRSGKKDWSSGNNRCLFVEEGMDRSIRCGCYKYILVENRRDGRTVEEAEEIGIPIENDNFYNLCDGDTGMYISAPNRSPERKFSSLSSELKNELMKKVDCHLQRTNPSEDPKYNRECDKPLDTPKIAEIEQSIENDDFLSSLLVNPWTDTQPEATTSAPTNSPVPQPSPQPSSQPSSQLPSLRPTYRPTYAIKPLPISTFDSESPASSSSVSSTLVSNEMDSLNSLMDSLNSTEIDIDIFCSDDLEYLYYGRDGQDCQWVIESARCESEDPETRLHVGRTYCPESCSYCRNDDDCFDNLNFQWYGREGHDCAWLQENDRCDTVRDAVNGASVHLGKQYCPESCGYCPDTMEKNETIIQ